MNQSLRRFARAMLAGAAPFLCLALAPVVSHAQAWLPPEGSFSYSIDYSNVLNKKHYTKDGEERDVGHTDIDILSISGSYSISDRVSVNASLPVVRSRYRGEGLGGHDHKIDDGNWHSTITDLQVSVNFQATQGPVAFAPYVGMVMPTHNYTTLGHSAPGRDLNEFWLGFYSAVSLNEWIPRTYVQVRGNYAFVEKLQDIDHDRINATLEIGYFINPSWNVRALVSQQWTDGGISVPVPQTSPLFPDHDRLAAEEFITVGAGATWIINDRTSVYGLYMQAIEGSNAHKVDHRVSVGVGYGVGAH